MTVERWEIWLATLEPVVGFEQGKTRPVLVLSSTALNQIYLSLIFFPSPRASRIAAFTQMKL
jgi:mRNA-degrading endonuclease toxin of MazEF toxin-antitoxin module